jgi:prepilin-type N-terminal cleavage/methylation domain-containing protein
MKRLRRLVRGQAGYSLVELVTVMLILATILSGITSIFIESTNAELDANNRVQAQLQATAAFEKLRRDVHCASAATITGATITLTGCASGDVSWCALASGTQYNLYRLAGSSCDSTGKLYAEHLISSSLFTYTAPVSGASLAKVHADLQVTVNPAKSTDTFELVDDLVLRNSLRA